MNVPMIEVDKAEARVRLKALRANMHATADSEYKALEKFYVQAGQGRKVVDLDKAFIAAPIDAKGRPLLAVARAHAAECMMRWNKQETEIQFFSYVKERSWTRPFRDYLRVDMGRLMPAQRNAEGRPTEDPWCIDGWALLPTVPPEVRAKFRSLNGYHILWEVPQWAKRSHMKVPRDPFLLRHVVGNLYAVMAEWEITEIERQVFEAARVV